jgi:MFS family permease
MAIESISPGPGATRPNVAQVVTKYRWVICGLLLFSTTVNYMDRQVISYLKEFFCTPVEKGGFGWSNTDFGHLTACFTGFYAGMTILAGGVIDKIGTKLGLALSLIIWSIFGIANAFVGRVVTSHILIRSAFGIGEAGNFPASIKTVAEWFPKRERALATGIFNSGSNIGAMIAALFVPWCMIQFGDEKGWKMAFILTGALGFIWLIFWFWLYDVPSKSKRLSKAEYDYIHVDDETVADQKPGDKARANSFGNPFSFGGRIPRAGYWGSTLLIIFLGLFIFFVARQVITPDALQHLPAQIFLGVVGLVVAWALLAVQAKRWHDLGKSGAFALVNMLPIIGAAVMVSRGSMAPLTAIEIVAVVALVCLVPLGLPAGAAGPNHFGEKKGPGVLGYPQTWAFFWGKFMTDGVWWFYLFWLPDYLTKQFHMDKHQIMMPTFIVYGVAIFGSVYGGSLPMTFIKKGMQVYKARMLAMLIIAVFPLFVLLTQYFGNVSRFGSMAAVLAVAMICIGAAAHQAWSANLFTTVSDMFPKKSVGSVTGVGAMSGGLGGVLVQLLAGYWNDLYKATPQTAYLFMFIVCALSYLIAWCVMKILVPRHKPITEI